MTTAKFWLGQPTKPTLEHSIFLWCLICKYLFCPASGKPSSQHFPLACFLDSGRSCNLGAICLGALYHGLRNILGNKPLFKLTRTSWLLQLWPFAYIPSLHHPSNAKLTISDISNLINCKTPLTSYDLLNFFGYLSLDQVSLYFYPNMDRISLSWFPWVKHVSEFKDNIVEEISNW